MLLVATVCGTVNECNCFIYAQLLGMYFIYEENVSDNLWNICFGGFSVSNIYVKGLHFLLLLIRECSECSVI